MRSAAAPAPPRAGGTASKAPLVRAARPAGGPPSRTASSASAEAAAAAHVQVCGRARLSLARICPLVPCMPRPFSAGWSFFVKRIGQTSLPPTHPLKVEELTEAVTELKLKVETAERERDFYFDKLRDIEVGEERRAWMCGARPEVLAVLWHEQGSRLGQSPSTAAYLSQTGADTGP